MLSELTTNILPFATVVGPILLVVVLAWAKLRTGRNDRRIDPGRAADDPARGMGADRSAPEPRREP